MLYNVTKVYVLNSQVLYVDQGEISRDSSNFNQIDVITNVTGFSAEIAFKLPNGVFSNSIGLIQQTGTVIVPSGITELQSVAGQAWSTYTMLIDNAVLSAITSTTSQTLEFSVRFSNQITNLLVFDEFSVFPTVGEGDKVYQADNTKVFYIWNGVNYVTKTQQEANALIITEGQVYTTEPSFLSLQGTIGGQPVALDPAFYQTQIVSSFNNLVSLYNAINNAITNATTGLPAIASKVSKSGDTMTGALAFSAGQQAGITRLNLNNNKVVTTDGINATTFSNGDKDSDAIKFSDLAPLFAVTAATPTGQLTWVDTFAAALANKFAGILSETELNGIYVRRDGTVAMTNDLNLSNNDIINLDGIASISTEIGNKVNKTTTIAGIDLQNNITLQEVKDAIGEATTSLSGLMSSTDKTSLDNLVALLATDDADNVVNTIGEVLAIFSQYPEGADLVTTLSNKVETSVVGDRTYTQDTVVTTGQSITASIDALAVEMKELTSNNFTTTLKDKLDGIASGAEVNVQSNFTESDNTSDAFILNIPSTFPPSAHGHIISEVTNLETELSGKEPAFTKNTAFNKNFGNVAGTVTEGNDARLSDARTPLSHSHVISDVTGLETALGTKPTIDPQTGKIPVSVIPFQFDDVLQGYIDQNVFYEEPTFITVIPAAQGKLYIDISTNDIYRYDGTNYVLVKEAVSSLSDIPNVTLTSEASGDLLRYNGTVWINDLLPLEDLENVVITNVADGQYLKYDNATSKWINTNLDAPVIDSLNAIDDVDAPTPSSGDILQYNASTTKWEKNRINFVSATAPTNPYVGDFWFDSSTLVLYVYYNDGDSVQWVNAVSGIVEGQPEELNDLTDVNIVSPTNGQVLTYNTSTQLFENQSLPAETGLANVVYLTTTIATGNWSGTAPVTAVKTVSGILSTDKPLIDIDLSSVAFANVEAKQTEYAKIYRVAATGANEITFYALEAPTEELIIQIKVVR